MLPASLEQFSKFGMSMFWDGGTKSLKYLIPDFRKHFESIREKIESRG